MLRVSLPHAKAHLSALVDQVEHENKRFLLLRDGRPAAAIVPVHGALRTRKRSMPIGNDAAERSVRAFVEEFSAAEHEISAVEDLSGGRR